MYQTIRLDELRIFDHEYVVKLAFKNIIPSLQHALCDSNLLIFITQAALALKYF